MTKHTPDKKVLYSLDEIFWNSPSSFFSNETIYNMFKERLIKELAEKRVAKDIEGLGEK